LRYLAWEQYHQLLCARDSETPRDEAQFMKIQKYISLINQSNHPARLEMCTKILATIILRNKNSGETLDETIDFFLGHFVAVPFSEAFYFSSVLGQNLPQPRNFSDCHRNPFLENNSERKLFFEEYLKEPLAILREVLYQNGFEKLFSEDFFDYLVGIPILNSREIRVYSPFHVYFSAIEKSSYSFHFLPIMFKMETKFGGIPRFDASSLCHLYSCLNHSCDYNAAVGISEEAEWLENSQQFAKSGLYAYKDIKEGEEIVVSYIHIVGKSREQRNSELRKQYFFECNCLLCAKEKNGE